jgi:hypothetical protein
VKTNARLIIVLLFGVSSWLAPRAGAVPAAAAHKYYTSLAQVEYNAEGKTVEVALRVFADDLELALTRRAGRPVSLERTKDADRMILDYLRETFEIKNRDGRTKGLELVGKEVRSEVAWLYLEAAMPEGLAGARLRVQILFELFDEQVNVVSVRHAGERTDLVFVRGDGERAVPARPSAGPTRP